MKVIYGAGNYAKKLYTYLNNRGITIDCFCVTNINDKDNCFDIPVMSLDELIPDHLNEIDTILISLSDKNISRIIREDLIDRGAGAVDILECGGFVSQNLKSAEEEAIEVLYKNHPYECSMAASYWRDRTYEDISDDVKSLKMGLSDDDCEQVDAIIHRMKNLPYASEDNDIFTIDEKIKIRRLEREFYKQIKNDGKCIEWHNWKVPAYAFMEPLVWYYKCGVGTIQNLEAISHMDIIDAGAYIGDSSVVLSDYTKGYVYAFEASVQNFEHIYETCRMNNVRNVIAVNKAISDSCGVADLYLTESGRTNALNKTEADVIKYKNSSEVETITIDKFVQVNDLRVGLIKSDIEGAELKLLKGAKKTIDEQKPFLLISIYHSADDFFGIKKYIQANHDFYTFKIFQPWERNRVICDTMLVCEPRI